MKSAQDAGQSMQRVRVGLIGLLIVVLLIALASAMMRSASREAPVAGTPRADPIANMGALNQQAPGEPLSELGVAPATGNVQPAAGAR